MGRSRYCSPSLLQLLTNEVYAQCQRSEVCGGVEQRHYALTKCAVDISSTALAGQVSYDATETGRAFVFFPVYPFHGKKVGKTLRMPEEGKAGFGLKVKTFLLYSVRLSRPPRSLRSLPRSLRSLSRSLPRSLSRSLLFAPL